MVGKSRHNPTNFLILHKPVILFLNYSSSTTTLRWERERKGAENMSEKEQGLKSDQSSHTKKLSVHHSASLATLTTRYD